ncbi:hypothetical protein RIF29_18294 [Crotalaria pallida]|uniref:Uncharacterized protein n=1 Tax=Crotalaria pallida TaxID=3830 RepID=A0AAN9FSF1_CROPI
MDESGILMSPSQLSQFFENESFNLYAPNHGDDELSEWLLSQDIPVAPTSSVEHNQNQNPDLTQQIQNKPRGSTVVVTLTVFKNPEFYKVGLGENGEGCVVADANVGAGAVAVAVAGHHNPVTGGGGNYNVSALQNIPSLTFPQSY